MAGEKLIVSISCKSFKRSVNKIQLSACVLYENITQNNRAEATFVEKFKNNKKYLKKWDGWNEI